MGERFPLRSEAMITLLKSWAKQLKRQIHVLRFALKDARTPWLPKAIAACVLAYAFSPIDLIPDFIPLLGLLDDVILLPLGIWFALRLIPKEILRESKVKADSAMLGSKPKNWTAGIFILVVWIVAIAWVLTSAYRIFFDGK